MSWALSSISTAVEAPRLMAKRSAKLGDLQEGIEKLDLEMRYLRAEVEAKPTAAREPREAQKKPALKRPAIKRRGLRRRGRVSPIAAALVAALLPAGATALADTDLREPTPTLPYPVVDTGQQRTYGDRSPIRPPHPGEPFYGQDAQVQGRPMTFRDNGDETVTDLQTGLCWQKTPDFRRRTWDEAATYASSLRLGGHRD